jgi:hypothetical protein
MARSSVREQHSHPTLPPAKVQKLERKAGSLNRQIDREEEEKRKRKGEKVK